MDNIQKTYIKYLAASYGPAIIAIALVSPVIGGYAFAAWLGDPIGSVMPWALWDYRVALGMDQRFQIAWYAAATGPFVILYGLLAILLIAAHLNANPDGGRWSTIIDQIKAGLRNSSGIILARIGSVWLRANLSTHVFVVAPTGSGKGLAVVIPNALVWYGSFIAVDIKLEIWKLTSGFRSTFSECFLFAPGSEWTWRYNPFSLIRRDEKFRVGDIHRIASYMIPEQKAENPMWPSESINFFTAVVLYLMDTGRPVTPGETFRTMNKYTWDKNMVDELIDDEGDYMCEMAIDTFTRIAHMGEKQREGIRSGVMAALRVYSDPLIDAATSRSDFDLRDLRKKRMSIYLGVHQRDSIRLAPLFALLIQQILETLVDDIEASNEGLPVQMLVDELPALGRMVSITKFLGFLRGYGVRFVGIAQNIHQIFSIFGDQGGKDFLGQFRHIVYYAPNTGDGAAAISRDLGYESKESVTTNKTKSGTSKTTTKKTSPLLDVGEVRRLSSKKAIIIQEGQHPTLANKFNYLKVRKLVRRTKIAAPSVPTLSIGEP